MRKPVKLCFLKCLLWLMNHFAVLTHKPSSLPLPDNLSKLVKTNVKSHRQWYLPPHHSIACFQQNRLSASQASGRIHQTSGRPIDSNDVKSSPKGFTHYGQRERDGGKISSSRGCLSLSPGETKPVEANYALSVSTRGSLSHRKGFPVLGLKAFDFLL